MFAGSVSASGLYGYISATNNFNIGVMYTPSFDKGVNKVIKLGLFVECDQYKPHAGLNLLFDSLAPLDVKGINKYIAAWAVNCYFNGEVKFGVLLGYRFL